MGQNAGGYISSWHGLQRGDNQSEARGGFCYGRRGGFIMMLWWAARCGLSLSLTILKDSSDGVCILFLKTYDLVPCLAWEDESAIAFEGAYFETED
jgi:hypothetical protein